MFIKRRRRRFIIFGSFALLVVGWIGWRVLVLTGTSKLRVGPQTTVVGGPVRADGTLDFVAALHKRSSVGITPENNAAVLLQMAFGPADMPLELREQYYRYLGIPKLPESGEYAISQQAYAQRITESPERSGEKYVAQLDEMGVAQQRPWNRAEFPRVAAWIDSNKKPLELIEQASLRTQYYSPLVSTSGLMAAPVPMLQNMREIARLLITRANLRISEGDLEGAGKDLMTCHRLANLVGQNSPLIGNLVGIAMVALATQADQIWLAQPLTEPQIKRFQADFSALPAVPDVVTCVDQNERLMMLDTIQSVWRGTHSLGVDSHGEVGPYIRLSSLDINVVMRRCNATYDKHCVGLRLEGVRIRLEALRKLDVEMVQWRSEKVSGRAFLAHLIWNSRQTVNEWVADYFMTLMAPASVPLETAHYRAATRRELVRVALALAMYRAKHGAYPEKLDALKPEFLKQIPLDSYDEQPLRYQIRPQGYLLYAIGTDGKDDGGQPIKGDQGDVAFEVTHEAMP